MFDKLLASLPFDTSLLDKITFYRKRLMAEQSVRRIGLAFITLGFLVQFFAFISPPVPTLADSTNDLVNGGFTSAATAALDCRENLAPSGEIGYGTILAHYGISCDKVASASTLTIKSTDFGNRLYSMGRIRYSYLADQQPVNIDGSILYTRLLSSWDSPGHPSTYQALNVTTTGGQTFLLLYTCGNLTSVGPPVPVTPPPSPPPPVTIPPIHTPPPSPPKCPYDSSILESDSKCVACSTNTTVIASSSECKPCKDALSSQDTTACVEVHKTAANLTEKIANANGTTAQAGDIIQYTLYANNSGDTTVKNYVFQDNLTYVLDYATLISKGGGKLEAGNNLTWPAEDIKAKETALEHFEVQVDNPIPQTPTSSSDPNYFNLVMSNYYGNTININLPASPLKAAETINSTLPNTGPGESLFFAAAIVVIAGYFVFRTKILVNESTIAIRESIEGEL